MSDKQLALILRTIYAVAFIFISSMVGTGAFVWKASSTLTTIQSDITKLTVELRQDRWPGRAQAQWSADLKAGNHELLVPNPYNYIENP